MKKSPLLAAVICVCLLAVLFIGIGASHKDGSEAGEPGLLAEYHGEKVYQADVEAYSDTAQHHRPAEAPERGRGGILRGKRTDLYESQPSPELVQAREDYVADLFAQARGEITYYNGAG